MGAVRASITTGLRAGRADYAAVQGAQPRAGVLGCRTGDRDLCSRVRDGARDDVRLGWLHTDPVSQNALHAHRVHVPPNAAPFVPRNG
jgi:hypothetical protein